MKGKRIIGYILLLLILLLGITFASINATPVSFDYYFSRSEIPLSLLLAYTLGVGILLGFLSAFFTIIQLKNNNRKLKHQLKETEKNLSPKGVLDLPAKD
ncbi:MAG: uncharacterized protein K0Q74_617 [Gammaproteobacteria bacterium]|jgi:putative membrane protein|nr:uncharacterized protein [Gammaproteobacteria bacterium]